MVGDRGQVHLDGGFGDAAPLHSPQAIASFTCPKYLFDAAPRPMDWLAPFFELSQRRPFVAGPHARGDNVRQSALSTSTITEMTTAIGAVCKYLTRIAGQRIGAYSAIIDRRA